ncbi:MAG: phosphoribosylformylglycinamidine cyclo-ligase [Halanaerobiales bacterium]
MGISYKDAGVDIEAGNEAVTRIKKSVESTFGAGVITGLGGFGGAFAPDLTEYGKPVLISGTDGVGTKLKLAFMMDRHDTIGIDLVAMCVNDILAQGAKPLFFLDYLAIGKLKPEKVEEIVRGIVTGCKRAECSLIGGETAELPDFYNKGEYDLAGFTVGIVDESEIITGEDITPGDKVIGLASNGVHSNGYSLVRKIFFEMAGAGPDKYYKELQCSLGEELLKPTRIYVKTVLKLLKKYKIKGIAHITGGGIMENVPRILPDNTIARIKKTCWELPEIFKLIQNLGSVDTAEMYRTFNMGIGMVIVVPEKKSEEILNYIRGGGEKAYIIGNIIEGKSQVTIID